VGCILKGGGGLYSRLVVGAVVLAAGEGRRMGSVPKGLIEIAGVPLIKRQLIALSGAGVDELVVVTGHYSDQIEAEIAGFPITITKNNELENSTQGASLRLGLSGLTGRLDAVVVVPSDMPLLGTQDYTDLIGAYKKRPEGVSLVRPLVGHRLGNPIIFDSELLVSGETTDERPLCRRWWTEHPEQCLAWETDNDRYCIDLDTHEDILDVERRLGRELKIPDLGAITVV
jgi:molybdenum cofactor cytidylyltransferase